MRVWVAAAFLPLLLSAAYGQDAAPMKPGRWEITMGGEQGNGKLGIGHESDCVSDAQAREPAGMLLAAQASVYQPLGATCAMDPETANAGHQTRHMRCMKGDALIGDVSADVQTFSATIKGAVVTMTDADGAITRKTQFFTGKYLGPCR